MSNPNLSNTKDFIYRYKINTNKPEMDLVSFYKQQIKDLLEIVDLYSSNKKINLNGFSFINKNKIHKL
ncbi:MAG: hypothetical protein ABIA04_15205 [Pseudomonadota bacterium]